MARLGGSERGRRGRASRDGGRPRPPLWRRLRLALPLMLFALIFTAVFNRLGLLTQLETTILDAQMRLDEPEGESPVVIVDITQQDFEQFFHGQTRPLHPGALRQLIDAVARGRPCVIGVDVDTHFPQFRTFEVSKSWPPVVWAREVTDPTAEVGEELFALDVLGGQDRALNNSAGVALLIDDPGKITRRYTRLVGTTEGPLPTFPWAIYKASRSARCAGVSDAGLEASTGELLIRYSRGREGAGRARLPASHVLRFAGDEGWGKNTLVGGKIVIIGGSYLGDDMHNTPLGRMAGVEVMANVVESEASGGGIIPPSPLAVVLLLLFEGFLLIALFQVCTTKDALLLTLPVIITLSLACSWLSYSSFSRWAFFAPVMIGVVVAEIIDMLRDRYKQEIKDTYASVSGDAPGRVPDAPLEDESRGESL